MLAAPSSSPKAGGRKNSLVEIASVVVASNRFHHHDERYHPGMIEEVARWWKAAVPEFDTGEVGEVTAELSGDKIHKAIGYDKTLQKHEYEVFYSRLVYAFNNDDDDENNMDAKQILSALETDWKNDSRDDGTVDEIDFKDSIYELADCWVQDADGDGDIDADDMVLYLKELYTRVFGADKEKVAEWWDEMVVNPGKEDMKASIRKSMKRLQKHSRVVGKLAHWGGLKKAMKITGHWHKMRTNLLKKIIMTRKIALFAGAAGARASQRREKVKKQWVVAAAKAHGLQRFISLAAEAKSEKYNNPEDAHSRGGGTATDGYHPKWYTKNPADESRVFTEVALENDEQVLGIDFGGSEDSGSTTIAMSVQPNSEAAKAGVKVGDQFVMVKGAVDEYYEEAVSEMNKKDVEQLITSKSCPKRLRFLDERGQVTGSPQVSISVRPDPSSLSPQKNPTKEKTQFAGSGHFVGIGDELGADRTSAKDKMRKGGAKAWRSPYSLYVLGLPQESSPSNQLIQSSSAMSTRVSPTSGRVSPTSGRKSPTKGSSKAYFQFSFDEGMSSPEVRHSVRAPSWQQQQETRRLRPSSAKKTAMQLRQRSKIYMAT